MDPSMSIHHQTGPVGMAGYLRLYIYIYIYFPCNTDSVPLILETKNTNDCSVHIYGNQLPRCLMW